MLTAIVDYESGNLHSAHKAFERIAVETDGGAVVVTSDPALVGRADRIVLPGDGAFPACRRALFERSGLAEAIARAVIENGRPFLGICIGMQLLASRGLEYQPTEGLSWIAGTVEPIAAARRGVRVPHMGWNDLILDHPHPILAGLTTGDHAYFVHSYHFVLSDPTHRLAHCDYGGAITAIVGRDNIVGTQFHPEKSQTTGLRLIANFLHWNP